MIGSVKKFFNEVTAEMKKVSWPSKEQLKESTMVVLGVSGLVIVFVALSDKVTQFVITNLFSVFN